MPGCISFTQQDVGSECYDVNARKTCVICKVFLIQTCGLFKNLLIIIALHLCAITGSVCQPSYTLY